MRGLATAEVSRFQAIVYVKDGPEVWEYEDPPESGQWKLVLPDHQKLCTGALDDGLHEITGHDTQDKDAEWDYNFSDGTVRFYRGRLCRCTWSLRRIQRLKVKHRHRSSRPKLDIDSFRYPRRCVQLARAVRRTVLGWVPRSMTTAIARKCRRAGHVRAEGSSPLLRDQNIP